MFIFCIVFVFSFSVYFPVLLCLSVSVRSLAVKTASEMTYIVSGEALNSTHSLTHSFCVNYVHRSGATLLNYDQLVIVDAGGITSHVCSLLADLHKIVDL